MRGAEFVLRARRTYNGWLIVGVTFLAAALTMGTSNYAFGQFIPHLEQEFDWHRTAIKASLSFMAVGALASPLIGRIMDRYGAKPVMAVSLTLFGLSFLLRPLMTDLWHWYALSFMQFVALTGTSLLPAGRLVGIWFPKHRGRVMGLSMMGNNFGGATMPAVVWLVLSTASWEAAFVVIALIAFAIAILSLIVVRERPVNTSSRISNVEDATLPPDAALTGWTLSEALRTKSIYAMAMAMMLASFTSSGVLPWVSVHLANEGMSESVVPRALALMATFGMMGKLSFGYLAEVFTARRAMMLSLGGQIIFISLMVGYPTSPMVWVSVPLYGLCMGAYGVLVPLIVQEAFGLKYYGSISGLISMATVVPFALAPLMAGASFDITESYGPAFLTVAVLALVGIAALTQVRQTRLEEYAGR
jgi:MFS family permease